MNTRYLSCAIAWTLTAVMSVSGAMAQTAQATVPPASAPGASQPPPKAGPRLLTPAEQRENATPQDDLRRDGTAVPQLSFPLGKPAPGAASKPALRAPRPDMAASGGVRDEVARCEAQADSLQRAKCRERLAQQGQGR
jgi:hypothetical protein